MLKKWIILLLCLTRAVFLNCLEVDSLEKAFLFNVPSILMEVQAYQGGIGFKAGPGTWFVRGMVDFLIENDGLPPSEFSWGVGVAFEKHLLAGKVSPYVGGAVGIRYGSSRTDYIGGDWSREEILNLEIGPLLGVELELLENLSLFAEYQLLVQLGWPGVTTFTGGMEERVSGDMQWSVDMTLGNGGMIGLCIYF